MNAKNEQIKNNNEQKKNVYNPDFISDDELE